MDDHQGLDGVARGLADGTVSRRRALKLGAAGVAAGIGTSLGFGSKAAARRGKRCLKCPAPTSCAESNCGLPRGNADFCVCVEDVNGKRCCVGADCEGKRCQKNGDCDTDEICSKEARQFCCSSLPGPKGVCLKRCKKPS
jgi:hypothetical protein